MATKRVVVVCGWMGAKARPVAKYAELYKQLGYDAVVLLSSQGDFLTDGANVHPTAPTDLLPPTESLELIPHMLSNGGCRSWYCFEDHLRGSQRPFHVPAMVFDSAPSRATTKSLLETWKGAGNLPSLGLSLGMRAFLVQLTLYPRTFPSSFCTRTPTRS
ncbi:hypothetical protein SDRG_15359 [Saprolegnia diclina VS20]|uniref:Uncharacterized protein n=1 Tax=Saprolegnia diclina (strain VS20) TaxID=1156394 RepID=T0PN57_SAPDV|nr:hypothetical protein SDRG_15359 [Saprolegnia diclina VS20]EQC26849.1 hypothetical protein SDRG_15359 [Saprolegnia diclina VS20]|eukprot:XP_008619751.1 hypothetical protein SDRG_15359 [Saprolegnia diclina VS20]